MDKIEKAKHKLWIKVYVAKIRKGSTCSAAESYANQAVLDFAVKFEK